MRTRQQLIDKASAAYQEYVSAVLEGYDGIHRPNTPFTASVQPVLHTTTHGVMTLGRTAPLLIPVAAEQCFFLGWTLRQGRARTAWDTT